MSYSIEITKFTPAPNGIPMAELVGKIKFEGNDELVARINAAITEEIVNHITRQQNGPKVKS